MAAAVLSLSYLDSAEGDKNNEASSDKVIHYEVYQFEDTSMTSVLPTHWVNNDNKVKYDSKKAREYMKSGKLPYKKWKTFTVTKITSRNFDSYEKAYKAETILLDKSELDTTDVDNLLIERSPLLTKRSRKPVITHPDIIYYDNKLPKRYDDDNDETSDSSSDHVGESCEDPPEASGLEVAQKNVPVVDLHYQDPLQQVNEELNADLETRSPISLLATSTDIADLKSILEEHAAKLNEINANMIKLMGCVNNGYGIRQSAGVTFAHDFPLTTEAEIVDFDKKLEQEPNTLQDFKSFLLQLGGSNLRTTIKFIVRKLYNLNVQERINYTGREGKLGMKSLIQTQAVIETMQLNSGKTQAAAINEYMYHLQHATDRIRCANLSHAKRAARMSNND